jgi:hypothetical protein
MKAAKLLLASVLSGGTVLAGTATLSGLGVDRADEQVSLRQESAQSRQHGFFYAHRSHRGGGLRSGK